jgi:hypothetical protein
VTDAPGVLKDLSTRRRRALVVALVVALGLAAFSFHGSAPQPPPARASGSAVAAFVERAQAALANHAGGASYRVTPARAATGQEAEAALVSGLRTAVAGPATEPAYLVKRKVVGRSVRCLELASSSHPTGTVCETSAGLIAFYDVPARISHGAYVVATLNGG